MGTAAKIAAPSLERKLGETRIRSSKSPSIHVETNLTAIQARSPEGHGVQRGIDGDALVLEQEGGARIALKESGQIALRLPLERRPRRGRGGGGLTLAIIEESVVRELTNAIAFSAWLLDHLDTTQRITHIAMAAKIEASDHLGWRTQAEQDASPNSGTMRMGGTPDRPAVLDRPRAALKFDGVRLAEDIMVPLRRHWKA